MEIIIFIGERYGGWVGPISWCYLNFNLFFWEKPTREGGKQKEGENNWGREEEK
jgi:hypothetical protein